MSSTLFFSTSSTNGGLKDGLYSVPVSGGTPKFLSSGGGAALAVDTTHVYAVSDQFVTKTPVGGGCQTVLAIGKGGNGIAVNGTDVFWTASNYVVGTIKKTAKN